MSLSRRWAWPAGALALLACMAAAVGAYVLAGYSWDQVVEYRTPYGDYDRPWAAAPIPETADTTPTVRVVLVMCDGLTLDASNRMTSLNTLREYGADMVAITAQPSLSYPTWTTILSGATPDISGVTTNWFEGAVPVETLLDVVLREGRTLLVSAPKDFETLYQAQRAQGSYFDEWTDEYMTGTYVDEALALGKDRNFDLMVIHLPDADEVAHDFGAASEEYAAVTSRMDGDISRLVSQFQNDQTVFVICADHGHIASGGHGGWEDQVSRVPAVFVGPQILYDRTVIGQEDIAPTIAGVLGMPIPRHSVGRVLAQIIGTEGDKAAQAGVRQARVFADEYLRLIRGSTVELGGANSYDAIRSAVAKASEERMAEERMARLPYALAFLGAALLIFGAVGLASWRALLAAGAGSAAYFGVYNALFFLVHGHLWSLSAFNTEEYVQTFFNTRMIEAVACGLVGVFAAGAVYGLLRRVPRGPKEGYAGGWIALGPVTILVAQALLGLQVGWFIWRWGADVVWRLPDFKWAFKYDLDLIQATALGAAAVLAPLVTYLVGRFHPRVRRRAVADTTEG